MRKFKGTKGEWKKYTDKIDNHTKIWVNGTSQIPICSIQRYNLGVDYIKEAEANAELIAAAPELLKALIIAEKYLHNADRELKSGKTLRQLVNQAINKALE